MRERVALIGHTAHNIIKWAANSERSAEGAVFYGVTGREYKGYYGCGCNSLLDSPPRMGLTYGLVITDVRPRSVF